MSRSWRDLGLSLVGPALLLAAWTIAESTLQSPFLPSLPDVLTAFRENWLFERVSSDVLPSMRRLAAGYGVGLVVGVTLGTALGMSRWFRLTLEPIIEFLRSLPKIAIIPLFLIVTGTGDLTKILVIAMTATIPVLLNAVDGVRSIDPTLVQMARIYRLRRSQRVGLVLRWASPQISAGARTALALSFILMVTSEMVASTDGIGHFVLTAQRTFAIADMWSGILLLGLLGLLFNSAFVLVERRLMAWHRGLKASQLARG